MPLVVLTVVALAALAGAPPAGADPAGTLKVVTFNLLHGGPGSGLSGNDQALDRRLAIVARELRGLDPDVVALQESSIGSRRGNVAARLAAELGFHYVHVTTTSRVTPIGLINRLAAWLMDFGEGPAISPTRRSWQSSREVCVEKTLMGPAGVATSARSMTRGSSHFPQPGRS